MGETRGGGLQGREGVHSIGIIFFGNDTTAAAKHILDISVPWE